MPADDLADHGRLVKVVEDAPTSRAVTMTTASASSTWSIVSIAWVPGGADGNGPGEPSVRSRPRTRP